MWNKRSGIYKLKTEIHLFSKRNKEIKMLFSSSFSSISSISSIFIFIFFLFFQFSYNFSQFLPCKNSYSKIPKIIEPKINYSSTISKLFYNIKDNKINNTSCYEWNCYSQKYFNHKCKWCLPYVMVAGFSKCGTTAFCDKLSKHPMIKRYRKKEVNIFTKLGKFSWDTIETRIEDKYPENKANYWLDCTSGAFRDLQVPIHLSKYSPQTKVIFLVRDPWQRIGSYLEMIKRNSDSIEHYNTQLNRLVDKFRRHSSQPESIRLSPGGIKHIAEVNNFMYIENILTWIALLGSKNILVIDKYNLEHNPKETMEQVEIFLNLPPHNYSKSVLYSISSNSLTEEDILKIDSKFETELLENEKNNNLQNNYSESKSESELEINPELEIKTSKSKKIKLRKKEILTLSSSKSESWIEETKIHPPYSLKDKKLITFSKRLFFPSLCLFESVLGWQIRIITPEILRSISKDSHKK